MGINEAIRPIPNSYWVIPGQFAAGEYPGAVDPGAAADKVRAVLDAGIDYFVDLTEEGELLPYRFIVDEEARRLGRSVEWARYPIVDVSVPRSPGEMAGILDAIDSALAHGRNVYVHCWGGVGRTGTVVGCWLVRHGCAGDEALAELRELWQGVEKIRYRPASPETREQREYVRQWAEPSPWDVVEVDARARFRGCLVGLAAGDALGTTLEFQSSGSFEPIVDMVGGGPFGLDPGQWTDDTSMALCLAASLIESEGFDPSDQMRRYVRWWREGYMSSTGRCFDIGITTSRALSRFVDTGEPYSGPTDAMSAGNGSLMRLAPVPMYFAADPGEAMALSADSSRTTHGAEEAVDSCRYFAGLLVGALRGVGKEELLSPLYCPVEGYWERNPLSPKVAAVAGGSFKHKDPPEIRGTGYVVDTLEAVLWAFHRSGDFREGALRVVNLGDDADTTGAVYGQLAGACYGVESIPPEWRRRLAMGAEIESLADSLFERGGRFITP